MTEMAPVGYVGISPKCILGFNKVVIYFSYLPKTKPKLINRQVLLNNMKIYQLILESKERRPFSHNLLTQLFFGAESRGGDIPSPSH